MVTIRLQRRGRKKRPIHHIVVADSRSPRDGRIVENLGRFNNLTAENEVSLNEERTIYWLKQGAQPSDTVRSILKQQGVLYKMHLLRWGKSEEEIETALNEWRESRSEKQVNGPTQKERQRAMLDTEEKEYQKQLKLKAEEAVKEKAKKEALAAEEAEAEQAAQDDETESAENEVVEKKAEESETTDAKDKKIEAEEADVNEKVEAEAEEKAEDKADADVQSEPEEEKQEAAETKTEESEALAAQEEAEEESDTETQTEEQQKAQPTAKVSTDLLAKEAIDYIESTPLDKLEGFITDDESRVTVRRAWEEKQEG